jgi:integrase
MAEGPQMYRALVWLLGVRGLRIGEAVALRLGDIDTMRGKVSVTKTLSEVGAALRGSAEDGVRDTGRESLAVLARHPQ